MKQLHNLRLWVTHVTVSEEMMETGTASLAGLPRKLPRCQDGAILWFAGGEGDYIMQLLEGGKESSLTEADGDGAPSACLEKRCILLLLLSVSFFFFCSHHAGGCRTKHFIHIWILSMCWTGAAGGQRKGRRLFQNELSPVWTKRHLLYSQKKQVVGSNKRMQLSL